MAALGETVKMEVLVCVKAYPTLSTRYGEAVCVAGVRLDTPTPEWVRLFPVRFRDMPRALQFSKYEVIRIEATRHSSDTRSETWRPNTDSIVRGDVVPRGGHWPKRRTLLEPLVGPSMCELNRGRLNGAPGPSLGLVRPRKISGVKVRDENQWTDGQRGIAGQGNLFTPKTDLEKPGHAFSYSWTCEDAECNGHNQKIVDWELGEAYRSWQRSGGDVIAKIHKKWVAQMCAENRETMFFVGDQHTRPGQFLVLGVFWPEHRPNAAQTQLDLGQPGA